LTITSAARYSQREPEALYELAAPIADLTDESFLAAVQAGRSTGIEDVVALALGDREPPQTVP
jgi:hypothetical protein